MTSPKKFLPEEITITVREHDDFKTVWVNNEQAVLEFSWRPFSQDGYSSAPNATYMTLKECFIEGTVVNLLKRRFAITEWTVSAKAEDKRHVAKFHLRLIKP